MKKPLNIFTFVQKAMPPQECQSTLPQTQALAQDRSWELASEWEEEDFNVSDKSTKNEDENYFTASEGTVNQAATIPGF